MSFFRPEKGQGAVELIGGVAALVSVCAVVLQVVALGSAWLDAQSAARVADRARELGVDGAGSGRAALAPARRPGAQISRVGETHRVSIRADFLGFPIRLDARSR